MPKPKAKHQPSKKPIPKPMPEAKDSLPCNRLHTIRNILYGIVVRCNNQMEEETKIRGRGEIWKGIQQARDWMLETIRLHDEAALQEYGDMYGGTIGDPSAGKAPTIEMMRGSTEFNTSFEE